MNHGRWLVYRCIEVLLELDSVDDAADFGKSLVSLYGAETVRQAKALIAGQDRFFGLETLGVDMEGSAMHRTLLAAYDKAVA
jgi:ribosomal protein S12 methylthiotransferase accessory factor